MKYFILVCLVALIASCTKAKLDAPIEEVVFDLQIPVYEQENVLHYEIETSPDGQAYKLYSKFPATKNMEELYQADIDLSEQFIGRNLIYLRIKAVDIDGSYLYSPIMPVYK